MITPNALLRAKQAIAIAGIATTLAATINPAVAAADPAGHAPQPRIVSTAISLVDYDATAASNATIGVADSTLYNLSSDELTERLNDLKSLGVTDLRIGVPWVYIQPTRDTYDWSSMDNLVNTATAMGFSVTGDITGNPKWDGLVLAGAPNPTAYADFAATVAARYGTKIGTYEVWNEPNGAPFFNPVDAAKYTAVLKAAYTAIKAANPDAVVVAGALGAAGNLGGISQTASDFLKGMYAAGAEGYFDALSYHPYGTTLPFSSGADINNAALQQVTELYKIMVANGDGGLKIYGTEYGNATTPVIGLSPAEQAAFLQDFITAWNKLPFTGPAYVYNAQDLHTGLLNGEANFGLFTSDGTPKPAAVALAKLIAELDATGSLPDYTAPKLSQARDAYLQLSALGFGVVNYGLLIPNAIVEAAYQTMPVAGKKAFTAVTNYVTARVVDMLAAMAPMTQAALGAALGLGPALKDPQAAVAAAAVRFNRDLQHTGQAVAAALNGTRVTLASLSQPHTAKAVTAAGTATSVAATKSATGDATSDAASTAAASSTSDTAASSTKATSDASDTDSAPAAKKSAKHGDSQNTGKQAAGGRHRKADPSTSDAGSGSSATGTTTAASAEPDTDTTKPANASKHKSDSASSAAGNAAGPKTSTAPKHARSEQSSKKTAPAA